MESNVFITSLDGRSVIELPGWVLQGEPTIKDIMLAGVGSLLQ